jgi:putative sigma-54 modulation protein
MKLVYTGKQDKLTPPQQRKVDARVAKISKLLLEKGRGEKEGHVVLSAERHLQRAELTVRFFDHALVSVGASPDQFTAVLDSLEKVEKQLLKLRTRWRDTKRTPEGKLSIPDAAPAPKPLKAAKPAKPAKPAKVVNNTRAKGKPLTVDEAMMLFNDAQDYLIFQDADTSKTCVLVRRRDGKLDLIQP